MAVRNAPWNWNEKVTTPEGKATPEFLSWLQQQLATNQLVNGAVPQGRIIATGTGLLGGGDLTIDRTHTLDPASPMNVDHTTVDIIAGVGLDGGGDISADRTIDLADTAVTPGVYGDATHSAQITIDQQGRITTAVDVAISGGGGGGGSSQSEAAFNYPDMSAFTWFQQGTSTATFDAIGTALDFQGGANLRSLFTTVPAFPFDVYTRVKWLNESNTAQFGAILKDSTNDKMIMVMCIPNSGNTQFYIQQYDGNSFNANLGNIQMQQSFHEVWYRIHATSASNLDFYVSIDGISWQTVGLGINPSGFLTVNRQGVVSRCDGHNIARVSYFGNTTPTP